MLLKKYKSPIVYSASGVIKTFSQLIVTIFVGKFITPYDLGLWTSINLFLSYSVLLQSGIINGLNRELPFNLGRGDSKNAEKLAGTAQSYTLLISFIAILVSIIIFFTSSYGLKLKYTILTIGILIALTYYQHFLFATYRSKSSFLKLSYILKHIKISTI